MSLFAYNLTTAPLALPGVVPATSLPASVSAGARGPALDVTAELIALTAPQFAALQVQVAAGQVQYEWTGLPEFNTYTLVVGSAQEDLSDLPIAIYVGDWSGLGGGVGDDANPGTLAAPFATLDKAFSIVPAEWRSTCEMRLAPGSYVSGDKTVGHPIGNPGSWFAMIGTMVDAKVAPGDTSLLNLSSDVTSTDSSYVATGIALPPADGALRGAYVKNNTTGDSALVINNTTVLGVLTCTLLGDLPIVAGVDTFSIERPGSIISGPDVMAIRSPGGVVQIKDVKFQAVANPFVPFLVFPENTFTLIQGVDIDYNGITNRSIFGVHTARLAGGTLQGVAPFTFSPFADLYIHQSAGAGVVTFFDRASLHLTGTVMDRIRFIPQDFSVLLFETFNGKNSNINALESSTVLVGYPFSGLTPADGVFDGNPAAGAGTGVIAVTDNCFAKIGRGAGVAINNIVGPAIPVRIRQQSSAWIGTLSGAGNTGDAGIVVEQIATARINQNGPGSTTITALADVRVGSVDRSYAQLPFTETEIESLATGAAAAIGATNNITGLTGMTAADVGNSITITGSATPANNDTHLIIKFVSATEVVVASVLVADAGPLGWTLQSQRTTLNRAQ